MTPTINSLMVSACKFTRMMTGQIIGGADPQEAVRYQIVVMLMNCSGCRDRLFILGRIIL
jgi:putative ABC transport system permease protein